MLERRKDLRGIPRGDQDKKGVKEIGKKIRFLKRKYAQSQLVQEIEAGKAPSISRKMHVDKASLFRKKDLQTEMTRYNGNLFNVHE